MTDTDLLGIYLNDHLAGSVTGLDHFRRAAAHHEGTQTGADLVRIGREVAEDRDALLSTMRRLGVRRVRYKSIGAIALSQVSRLKHNGTVFGRSPLDPLIEIETLLLGVSGKAALWRLLLAHCSHESRLDPAEVARRVERSERHVDELERLRVREGLVAIR